MIVQIQKIILINIIKEKINKCNKNKKIKLIFSPNDNQLEKFIESIKFFW